MRWLLICGFAAVLVSGMAYAHITPTVVMEKRADVIKASLPSAANYFERKVTIGKSAYNRINAMDHFTPQTLHLQFFYGKSNSGQYAGTVLFLQMNTIHGPVEVGVAFSPRGRVSRVEVTKATVETEPWVKAAISAGLLERYVGMTDDISENPLAGFSGKVGPMPYFMARVITTAVTRAVVYYRVLFKPDLPK